MTRLFDRIASTVRVKLWGRLFWSCPHADLVDLAASLDAEDVATHFGYAAMIAEFETA